MSTPRFFQCNTTLSSPHQPIERGGDELPDLASNSRTNDSKFVETTVSTELEVKHAKNLPFGANAMDTIGEAGPIIPPSDPPILDRQSTSVKPLFGLVDGFNSATTTDPSDVDKNNSGRQDGAYCRGNTAMH